ncbi:poly(U)-specific 3'-to-5' RNA exonuclease [Exophiala xenobiotica]|uniref:U6 snRNA phosphodiesterase 1 n=1 Tax=Lithohypha guttulata TaxID=1690604 RepID=A0ABR0K8H9_9EURO|nr:poly(U)-specific 3'-to-5' RNA exonuclease [Lithohypha guttulata]KAK5312917.1 poly(U)-specific 3'-to-5' RNA exonuclease [Exophiala xenobiotica]
MSLIDYSDSDDDSVQTNGLKNHVSGTTIAVNAPLKRKRQGRDNEPAQRILKPAPSLPANFHTLYATPGRASTSDDPSLHAGRQRQVPHVVGNWPSFVYLEWLPPEEDLLTLERVIEEALRQLRAGSQSDVASYKLQSSLRSELGELTKAIQIARIPAFDVRVSGVRWVSNFDGTRHFLIVNLTKPGENQLQTLLSICNKLARQFGLPELYAHSEINAVGVQKQPGAPLDNQEAAVPPQPDDKFHISIAWTLVKPKCNSCVLDEEIHRKLGSIKLSFQDVLIKIGNVISNVHLREMTGTTSLLISANDSNEA